MSKMDEIIIVAPRKEVFENNSLEFQGVETNEDVINTIMSNISGSFFELRRGTAEEDPQFKQPIPYAFITRGDEMFVYERLKGAGETRLHSKLSVGVGGHMNYIPHQEFKMQALINLTRELNEELNISSSIGNDLKIIGLINDDSDEVGEVHIGLLTKIEVPEDTQISVKETEELKGDFIKIEDLRKPELYGRLENWSKIVIDSI